VLGRWASWGATPQLFDERRDEGQAEREELRSLVGEDGYSAARRTTINAHYTDRAYASEIWRTLERLGFEEGRVLEPGCGAGIFIGTAPAGAEMTGVELDGATAGIARALYPAATVRTESFAKSPFPNDHFDAVVGNVPFAQESIYDPRHNKSEHSLHNHFILKSLALTRPGGIVAVLTSRFTLDARDSGAREEMGAMADLVGAVRLPTGAHRRVAGTEVVTDLLVLRRREPERAPASTDWLETRPREVDGEAVSINSYFDAHPEHMLGELAVGHGQYNAKTLHVRGDLASVGEELAAALDEIAATAERDGLTLTPRAVEQAVDGPNAEDLAAAPEAHPDLWDGHLTAHGRGRFTVVRQGRQLPFAVPRTQAAELGELLGMRDVATRLLDAEAATPEDTPEIAALRADLRRRHEGYVRRHGPINRFTLRRTGRTDPRTGEERYARVAPPVMRHLKTDPSAPLVKALEVFDETTQTATPAEIMSKRVVVQREPVRHVDDPADAVWVSIERHARVDLDTVGELLGLGPAEARTALGELVYEDPADGRLVPAAEYLSGNVRDKLDRARAAVEERPELAVNVQALENALPADLGADEVAPRLGAVWIDAETHQRFLCELLGDDKLAVAHPTEGSWVVDGNRHSVAARSEWGTESMNALAIAEATLEQRPIQVTVKVEGGGRVVDPEETEAAKDKALAMQERFEEWLWEDPERTARLLAEYNRRFNSLVLRDYAADGERLTLPGLAGTFPPLRPHQRSAVARMLAEPAVGLFHEVGAGKTAEMVIGAMELKRLGLVSKPCVVVPNHMLEQFSREWLQLYPRAPPGRIVRRPGPTQAARLRRARRDQRLGRGDRDADGVRAAADVGRGPGEIRRRRAHRAAA
jgi:hypothetical protein